MTVDELREALKARITTDALSLRQANEHCGVSFSTLSRFLRGSDLSGKVYDMIYAWLTGEMLPPRKVISSRRMKVGGNIFLITIQQIL